MQGGVGHGPQVNPEAKLVMEILGQVHVGPAAIGCVSSRVKVTGEFIPQVRASDALAVDPGGNPVDCDLYFGDIGVDIFFSFPGARRVGVDK